MVKTTHAIGGALATCLVLNTLAPEVLAVGAIGGLIPDIDHQESALGRFNPFARFMEHRGFAHSLAFVAIVGLIATGMLTKITSISLALIIGMLSHLILDMLNVAGIQLLWPLKPRMSLPVHGIKTGGAGDIIIRLLMLALLINIIYMKKIAMV